MVQKSETATWDGAKTLVNNGISTTNLPQLVSLIPGFHPSTAMTILLNGKGEVIFSYVRTGRSTPMKFPYNRG